MFDAVERYIGSIRLPHWGRVVWAEGLVSWLVVDDGGVPVELIRALQASGAQRLALPRCGHCHLPKPLTQLDGEIRICGSCDRRKRSAAESCAACGVNRRIASRDRDGRPVCVHCVSYQSHDPVEEISTTIVRLDPGQEPQLLAEIIRTAIPRQLQRHKVLWELQDRPELLTGQGAHGSARGNALIPARRRSKRRGRPSVRQLRQTTRAVHRLRSHPLGQGQGDRWAAL